MGSFGDKLRKQRELRGMSLEAISNSTKISARMLRAIEDERFDQLPGGVFNKGFVRAYARQVGLNEDEAVADYLNALIESQVQQQAIPPDFRAHPVDPPASAQPSVKPPLPNPVSANRNPGNGLLNLEAEDRRERDRRNGERRNQDRRARKNLARDRRDENEAEQTLPDNEPVRELSDDGMLAQGTSEETKGAFDQAADSAIDPFAVDAFSESQSSWDLPNRVPWMKLAAALFLIFAVLLVWNIRRRSRSTAPQIKNTTNHSAASGAPAAETAVGSSAKTLPAAAPKPLPKLAASDGTPNRTTRPAAPKAPAAFTVIVRAEKTTWVSIVADGNPVAQETLIAPAHTSVRATHEVVVKTGNAAGISFLLNGRIIPSHGTDGETGTFVLDSSGLRQTPAP